MKYVPRPYQRAISEYILSHPRCAIWAEMGLGKSAATLTALNDLHFLGELKGPVLILAPLRVAWFHQPYLAKMIPTGELVRLRGKVSERNGKKQVANPVAGGFEAEINLA